MGSTIWLIAKSKKTFKENLSGTSEIVNYAKKKNVELNIEGELGYLVTESSKVYKKKIFGFLEISLLTFL